MKTDEELRVDRLATRLLGVLYMTLGQGVYAVHRSSGIKSHYYQLTANLERCERVADRPKEERERAAECLGWAFRDAILHARPDDFVFSDLEAKRRLLRQSLFIGELEHNYRKKAHAWVEAIERLAARDSSPPATGIIARFLKQH